MLNITRYSLVPMETWGELCNLSKLRARGESIKGVDGASSGVVPVMKLMEDTFSYVNQLG